MSFDPNHNEKKQEAVRITAAEFLVREASLQSLITVTRAALSSDAKRADIFITVFPESQEETALAFANRHRGDFGEFFSKKYRGVYAPKVAFCIDLGEKNRQRIDELSR
ncbi:MAG: ribosome-binding factor A [Minisyncoccia bacterium]|jgi:ribosome-binding factor A